MSWRACDVPAACCAWLPGPPHGPTQLLVFDHPVAGTQIVKGTVEDGETLQEALVRELLEEPGLLCDGGSHVGTWDRTVGGGPNEDGALELARWHVFEVRAPVDAPDAWAHQASGSEEEARHVFRFRWVDIDASLPEALHPLFHETATIVQRRPWPDPCARVPRFDRPAWLCAVWPSGGRS